jgi:hypothetical protein
LQQGTPPRGARNLCTWKLVPTVKQTMWHLDFVHANWLAATGVAIWSFWLTAVRACPTWTVPWRCRSI